MGNLAYFGGELWPSFAEAEQLYDLRDDPHEQRNVTRPPPYHRPIHTMHPQVTMLLSTLAYTIYNLVHTNPLPHRNVVHEPEHAPLVDYMSRMIDIHVSSPHTALPPDPAAIYRSTTFITCSDNLEPASDALPSLMPSSGEAYHGLVVVCDAQARGAQAKWRGGPRVCLSGYAEREQ